MDSYHWANDRALKRVNFGPSKLSLTDFSIRNKFSPPYLLECHALRLCKKYDAFTQMSVNEGSIINFFLVNFSVEIEFAQAPYDRRLCCQ